MTADPMTQVPLTTDRNPKPSIGQVTQSISRRMPWQVATTVFDWLDVQPSRGWDATVERYSDAKGMQDQADRLSTAFKEHIVAGEKTLRIYKVNSIERQSIIQWLHANKPKESLSVDTYYRDDADIRKADAKLPKLIAVEAFDTGVAGIFEAIRETEIRETIDPSRIRGLDNSSEEKFSQVIGVKVEKKQLFDVLWIPTSGDRIDIRTDSPLGTTIDTENAGHQALMKAIIQGFGTDIFKYQINLYPLIRSIYEDSKEGLVAELGFITSTGSVKHEKMRRSGTCLRTEIYHKAGKAALSKKIEPFKLSVRWHVNHVGYTASTLPELSLRGSTRLLHMTSPIMYDALIRGCAGVADFEYVRARVDQHLTKLGL